MHSIIAPSHLMVGTTSLCKSNGWLDLVNWVYSSQGKTSCFSVVVKAKQDLIFALVQIWD